MDTGESRTEDVDERTGLRRYRRESATIGGKRSTALAWRASGISERLVGDGGRTAGSVGAKRRGRSSLERDRVCELGSAAPVPLPFSLSPGVSPPSPLRVPLLPLRLPLTCIHRRADVDEEEEGRRRVSRDGEENPRPAAGSRYSRLPSCDGERGDDGWPCNFSVVHPFARSRHTSSRGRAARKNRSPAPRGRITVRAAEEEAPRLLPPALTESGGGVSRAAAVRLCARSGDKGRGDDDEEDEDEDDGDGDEEHRGAAAVAARSHSHRWRAAAGYVVLADEGCSLAATHTSGPSRGGVERNAE